MGRSPSTPDRFWNNVEVGEHDSCWPWRGPLHRDGYGKASWNGRTFAAHRLAYALIFGPIPAGDGYHGTVIRHKCDNKPCCNPRHLEPGTVRDNAQDMVERGRHRFVSNPPRGEQSPQAKLTADQVREIRRSHASGQWSQKALAAVYGVNISTIHLIVHRKNWKDV